MVSEREKERERERERGGMVRESRYIHPQFSRRSRGEGGGWIKRGREKIATDTHTCTRTKRPFWQQ